MYVANFVGKLWRMNLSTQSMGPCYELNIPQGTPHTLHGDIYSLFHVKHIIFNKSSMNFISGAIIS